MHDTYDWFFSEETTIGQEPSKTDYPNTFPTIYQQLATKNKDNLDVFAIDYYKRVFSFRDLLSEIDLYARAFLQVGVSAGSIVTICLPSVPAAIITFYALNRIGAISNSISIAFLKIDVQRIIDKKKSTTLIILDNFLGLIHDDLSTTDLNTVITVSLTDYLEDINPNPISHVDFGQSLQRTGGAIKVVTLKTLLDFARPDHFEIGLNLSTLSEDRDAVFLYTSGTTGFPKCAVFKDKAVRALVDMHENIPINDTPGDRSLLIIPPYYATSLFYEVHLQLCRGITLVLQPNYNKYTFAADLRDLKINRTLAAMSHYAALAQSDLLPGDLACLKIPGCGGEAVTLGMANAINEKLRRFGAHDSLIIGGGQTENGSCVFEGYTIKNRTNQTGYPLPGVSVQLVDPDSGAFVKPGERGELIVSSPAAMHRYFDDQVATDEYFTYDKNSTRWGHPRDIAIQNEDGSYTMKGRGNDSFINDSKQRVFLFDTEETVSSDPAILECEAVALPIANGRKCAHVLHVVLKPEYQGSTCDVIRRITSIVRIDGIRIRRSFATSEITGKRDIKVLLDERNDFYMPDERSNGFLLISFPYVDEKPHVECIKNENEINIHCALK